MVSGLRRENILGRAKRITHYNSFSIQGGVGNIIIYMAGGISGNLNPCFRNMARKNDITVSGFVGSLIDENFLAGGESRHWLHEASPSKENMQVYLANTYNSRKGRMQAEVERIAKLGGENAISTVVSGDEPTDWMDLNKEINLVKNIDKVSNYKPYILESFYYVNEDTEKLLPFFGDFLLDSGAFTFMQNSKVKVDWVEYIKKYANFINRNNIEKFFELDIDSVVGYKKVLEYRRLLENLTGKKCIPVWHKSRGYNEFCKMCDEYDYVAIGGIVSKEITKKQYKYLPKLIDEAHKRGTKIHGLGFTNLKWLEICHFDSVDSTSWTSGNKFGFVYKFDGKTMQKIDCPDGHRMKSSRKIALINYTEWIKFQRYAEAHL